MASSDSWEIPIRYYATVLCKTLFCTKGPFYAQLFRNFYIKNVTGWVMARIVTDSLGAFCPWFDSWEPGTVMTVSLMFLLSVISKCKIPHMNSRHMCECIAGHFSILLHIPEGEISAAPHSDTSAETIVGLVPTQYIFSCSPRPVYCLCVETVLRALSSLYRSNRKTCFMKH